MESVNIALDFFVAEIWTFPGFEAIIKFGTLKDLIEIFCIESAVMTNVEDLAVKGGHFSE